MKNKFLTTFLICITLLVGAVALSACGKSNDPATPPPPSTTYTLTLSANGSGQVYGSGSYDEGEDVTIYAIPSANHYFAYWNDGVVEPTRTVNMSSDITLEAHFFSGVGESKIINGHRVTIENGIFANETDENYFRFTTVEPVYGDDFGYWTLNNGNPISSEHLLRLEKNTVTEDCRYTFVKAKFIGYTFGINERSNVLPNHLENMQKLSTMDTSSLTNVHTIYKNVGKNDFTEYSTISGDNVYEITLANVSGSDTLTIFPIFEIPSGYWCAEAQKISLGRKPAHYSVRFSDGNKISQIIINLTYVN